MDNDNKKSAGVKVPNDYQMTAKSVVNELVGYVKTEQVAKSVGVTKQTVEYWRKRGWFNADLINHNGVYLYSVERVEQLKAVYRRDWQTAWRGGTEQNEEQSLPDTLAQAEKRVTDWKQRTQPPKVSHIVDYFANQLKADIDTLKNYANRLTGFKNIDDQQFFSPGLYVIGATPAAGKTTFCWQLLEQIAERGEDCIYCSYENCSSTAFP